MLSKIGTFYQHESTQARLYHLESLLQCFKWSMHPAECGCVDIPRAVVEQLSVLHQRFYSNLHRNLMDTSFFPPFFFFLSSLGLRQNPHRNSAERTGRHKIRYIPLFGLNVCLSNIIEKTDLYNSNIG